MGGEDRAKGGRGKEGMRMKGMAWWGRSGKEFSCNECSNASRLLPWSGCEILLCIYHHPPHTNPSLPPSLPPPIQGTMNMVQTDVMTLTRYMIENTKQFPDAQDLEVLMSSIQVRPSLPPSLPPLFFLFPPVPTPSPPKVSVCIGNALVSSLAPSIFHPSLPPSLPPPSRWPARPSPTSSPAPASTT